MNKLLKKDLIDLCKSNNIRGYSSMKKDDIITLLKDNGVSYDTNVITKETVDDLEEIYIDTEGSVDVKERVEFKEKIKFIDLFCGIGGFHQAMGNLGGECVFACDIDESCVKTYEKNYGLKPERDITKVDIKGIKPFNVLCAGFPCQPFSKAGLQQGFDDKARGNLFYNICDIVEYHKPKYLLLENVKNMSSHDSGNTWKVIHGKIDEMGYNVWKQPLVLNVLHFNIPQNRERMIILCKRRDLGELPKYPIVPKVPKNKLTNYITNYIVEHKDNDKYKSNEKMRDTEEIWNNFIQVLIANNVTTPKFPIWTDWWDKDDMDDLDNEETAMYEKYTNWIDKNIKLYNDNIAILKPWLVKSRECKNWKGAVRKFEWQAGDFKEGDKMSEMLWTARGSGIRVKRADYIPTLVAMGMIPVYRGRKLTPRELLKVQSFRDGFIFDEKNIYKQLGNAVNVTMIERSAEFLLYDKNLFRN